MWQQDAYRVIQWRGRCRHQEQDREPHLPGNGHHRVYLKNTHYPERAA
jgi:hypothetical protein